jgi:hypothetical protein
MKVEIQVSCVHIADLAEKQLKDAGLNPNDFKMLHNSAVNGGERGEGNLSFVSYTFERMKHEGAD